VKTIHAGTEHYYSAHAAVEQSGAVRHREVRVSPDYLRHARILDERFFPGTGTTPFQTRVLSFTQTRGAVFGAFGEASADVHDLIAEAATVQARRDFGLAGARSATEMRGFIIGQMRRRIGLAAVQAFARHRINRVPYIGVHRSAVQMRQERLQRRIAVERAGGVAAVGLLAQDFYAWQAGGAGGAVMRAVV